MCFIYRPEYYGITEDEEGNSTVGTGEIIIAKHRNGSLENVKLRFVGHLARFENLDSFDSGEDSLMQMTPNAEFDSEGPNTITVGSKMNDDDADDLPPSSGGNDFDFTGSGPDEDAPF